MEREDVIAVHGGREDLGALSTHARRLIGDDALSESSARDFEFLAGTIALLSAVISRLCARNEVGEAELVVTRSTSMRCAVRRLPDDSSLLMVPAGLLGRVRVMNRLLLSYWDAGPPRMELISSLWDARSGEFLVPSKLEPLLTETLEADTWWRRLYGLDATIELDSKFLPDAQELNHLVVAHVIWHEFGHLLRRHFHIVREIAKAAQGTGLGATDVERAIECDADAVADYLSVYLLIAQVFNEPSGQSDLALGFLRLGFALTALYSLYDPHKRVIADYVDGRYPHPQVRHRMSIENQGGAAKSYDLDSVYGQQSMIGVDRCLATLSHLEMAAMEGHWGERTGGSSTLHALRAPHFRPVELAFPPLVRLARRIREQREQQQRVTQYISGLYGEPNLLLTVGPGPSNAS